MSKLVLEEAVQQASRDWQDAFNDGDALSCADFYEDDAIMQAIPFGIYCGKKTIPTFWRQLIKDGYRDINYSNTHIKVINEQQAVLTAYWSMNKASGVIHKQMWVLQEDGQVKLSEDHFEAI
jgi:uncharacterized protein (TIGR02246 family)